MIRETLKYAVSEIEFQGFWIMQLLCC